VDIPRKEDDLFNLVVFNVFKQFHPLALISGPFVLGFIGHRIWDEGN
jgi:hypothetical protein